MHSIAAHHPPIHPQVVVGVPEEVSKRLDEEEKGWRISGKYAVVLVSDGDTERRPVRFEDGNK